MIALSFILLILAAGAFLLLRRQRPWIRFAAAIAFFILSVGALIAIAIFVGDPPPAGSIPIAQEVLDREGMTKEEWEAYVRSTKSEAADRHEAP